MYLNTVMKHMYSVTVLYLPPLYRCAGYRLGYQSDVLVIGVLGLFCHPVMDLCNTATNTIISLALSFSLTFSQEQEFLLRQQLELDGTLKKIIQKHKCELATVERDCLNNKQQLLRSKARCF